jgi:hypothetical protein
LPFKEINNNNIITDSKKSNIISLMNCKISILNNSFIGKLNKGCVCTLYLRISLGHSGWCDVNKEVVDTPPIATTIATTLNTIKEFF